MKFKEWWQKKLAEMHDSRGAFLKNEAFDLKGVEAIAEEAWLNAQVQWLDIKDAPKDGSYLLLGRFNYRGKWQSVNGRWFSKEQILDDWDFQDDDEGSNEDAAENMAGWYEVAVECEGDTSCWKINPSHFMFKPDAPGGFL